MMLSARYRSGRVDVQVRSTESPTSLVDRTPVLPLLVCITTLPISAVGLISHLARLSNSVVTSAPLWKSHLQTLHLIRISHLQSAHVGNHVCLLLPRKVLEVL